MKKIISGGKDRHEVSFVHKVLGMKLWHLQYLLYKDFTPAQPDLVLLIFLCCFGLLEKSVFLGRSRKCCLYD